ncbi:hypothetical protein MKEN_01159900 [Mycena kentingensis (nom. inval.)]|nr:hypothetical protein MKEN_01159900 [Mycena kentingensis (nom. inval.)]
MNALRRASRPTTRRASTGPSPSTPTTAGPSSSQADAADLPVYSGNERTEHVFTLGKDDSEDGAWAKLTLKSNARSAKSTPSYSEGDEIVGSFLLSSAKGDGIKTISVTLTGKIVTGAAREEVFTFLKHETIMWQKTTSPALVPGNTLFTFTIDLPSTVQIKDAEYSLPESFLERHVRASVSYEIVLRVARGWLRSDNEIKERIRYSPVSYAPPPSPLRVQAYRERTRLLGPEIDPQGWVMTPTVDVSGMLFRTRPVGVRLKMHIARPTSYARGTPIPLLLTISSTDPQALALLSAPASPVVILRRAIRYKIASSSPTRTADWETTDADLVRAALWPLAGAPVAGTRTVVLEGEIVLPKGLLASSTMDRFEVSVRNFSKSRRLVSVSNLPVQYAVVILAFDATGFVPDASESRSSPLLVQPVQITTKPPIDSPHAMEYTPASHVPLPLPTRHGVAKDDEDYYTESPAVDNIIRAGFT